MVVGASVVVVVVGANVVVVVEVGANVVVVVVPLPIIMVLSKVALTPLLPLTTTLPVYVPSAIPAS